MTTPASASPFIFNPSPSFTHPSSPSFGAGPVPGSNAPSSGPFFSFSGIAPPVTSSSSSTSTPSSAEPIVGAGGVGGGAGGVGLKRRVSHTSSADPHEWKRRRPNLANGFSSLSISPRAESPNFVGVQGDGKATQTSTSTGMKQSGNVGAHAYAQSGTVDDDDDLPPHQRDLRVEEVGEQSGHNHDARHRNRHHHHQTPSHSHPQPHPADPSDRFYRNSHAHPHTPRQNHQPGNRQQRNHHRDPTDDSSSMSPTSSDSDTASPYISRRPTLHADSVEVPDDSDDIQSASAQWTFGDQIGAKAYADGGSVHPEADARGVRELTVEDISTSPRRGMKRRTSSVSEGEGRYKKSKGLEPEDEMELELEMDEGMVRGLVGEEAPAQREFRGRSRVRGRRSKWHEPEKDRIIYTSLSSSPSRSRSRSQSRSRSRSTSPTSKSNSNSNSTPTIEELIQPGQQGFTISPSMLTRLLQAQHDGKIKMKLPFDISQLASSSTDPAYKSMQERGLVLYRPMGIPPGVDWREVVKQWTGTGDGAGSGSGASVKREAGSDGRFGDEGRFEMLDDDEVGDEEEDISMGGTSGIGANGMSALSGMHGGGEEVSMDGTGAGLIAEISGSNGGYGDMNMDADDAMDLD